MNNSFQFIPLVREHFPLLLKWLEAPHVKHWWDSDVLWDLEKVAAKYSSYTEGYKFENGKKRLIHAFVIYQDIQPIGYIQYYNAYDFPREPNLEQLPSSLAAFDVFIGEPALTGQGIGSMVLSQFLEEYVDPNYEFVFVDPDKLNERAISAYQKSGFQLWKHQPSRHVLWLVRKRKP